MAADERTPPELPDPRAARWQFLRDVVVFQAKLLLDGLRDLALSPVSLGAALFGLVTRSDAPGRYFYEVVVAGRRTERWIDLFEAADRIAPRAPADAPEAHVDDIFDRLGELLAEQQRRGGVTAAAKDRIDVLLDALPAAAGHRAGSGTDSAARVSRGDDDPPAS